MDMKAGSRERVMPLWYFESQLRGISSTFLWANHLALLVLSSDLVYLRVLPYVHFLAKMESREETYG